MRDFIVIVDWESILEGKDVQESWDEFSVKLEGAMQKFIPTHNIGGQGRRKKRQSYMDKKGLSMVKSKDRAWQKYLESRDLRDYKEYCNTRNALRTYTRGLRKEFEEKIASEVKDNPKAFWKSTKSKMTVRSGVSDLKDKNGSTHSDDSSKADILNDFFCSVLPMKTQMLYRS